ncbi:Rha family transcriptional regulator [Brevibacillus laterosporus]|uniref:ORF6C domain-containing protein n=1 Tax=Brevibacillus laterosporus TaxID=1465 RepID=UPI003D191EA6
MKQLQVINQNGQLLADSREVAEMVEKRHDHLIRDIEGYVAVLDQNPNLGTDHFFIESSYTSGTGKRYKCYLLTRKGCDMVANKMTGEKGVLFTAEYVTRFEEMEKQLNGSNVTGLSKELQAIFFLDKKNQEIETRVTHLEQTSTINYGQQQDLQVICKRRAMKIIGGDKSPAYQNANLRSKVFKAIWKDYQEYFNVNSYRNTAAKDIEKAKEHLQQWVPHGKLLREIEEANNQLSFV